MFEPTIKLTAKQLGKPIEDVRKQAPFAVARGLSRLAVKARDDVRTGMGKAMTIRRPWVTQGVAFTGARKSDWPNTHAIVGVLPDRGRFLEKQLETGTKKPDKGRKSFRIPTKVVRASKTANVPKGKLPGALLKRKGYGFAPTTQKGTIAVVKAKGRGKAKTLVRHWLIAKRIRIKRAWPFAADVDRSVARNFEAEMIKSFDEALRSAK
jgi:hypothetical protein